MAEPSEKKPQTIAGTSILVAPLVTGATYAATPQGFMRMLAEANLVAKEGWHLVSLVRLESAIAVLYRRVGTSAPTQFFEEEDADLG